MNRYRLRPHAFDDGEDHVWIAPLPEGPIIRVEGSGVHIVELMKEQAGTASAAQLTESLRQYVDDVPDGAEADIAIFLDELAAAGIVDVLTTDVAGAP